MSKLPLTLEATENGPELPWGHRSKRLRPSDFSEFPSLGLSAPQPRREARPAALASPLVRSWDLGAKSKLGAWMQIPSPVPSPKPLQPEIQQRKRVKPGQPKTAESGFKWDGGGLFPPHLVHSISSLPPSPTLQAIRAHHDLWLQLTLEKAIKKCSQDTGGKGVRRRSATLEGRGWGGGPPLWRGRRGGMEMHFSMDLTFTEQSMGSAKLKRINPKPGSASWKTGAVGCGMRRGLRVQGGTDGLLIRMISISSWGLLVLGVYWSIMWTSHELTAQLHHTEQKGSTSFIQLIIHLATLYLTPTRCVAQS